MRRHVVFFLITIIAVLWIVPQNRIFASTTDGTIDATNKIAEALNTNVGRINFGTMTGNVHVRDAGLTGYAWGENIGWINLAPANGGVINNAEGTLSGYAWGERVGWINFKPANGGVVIGSNGIFSGYAWGQNTGWIAFNCATTGVCGTDNFKVQTDWRPASTRTSGGGGGGGGGGGSGPTDVCPNIVGIQLDVPAGMIKDASGACVPIVTEQAPPDAPVISLKGQAQVVFTKGSPYLDDGSTAYDVADGDLTAKVTVTGSVNPNAPGTYLLRYDVVNSKGIAAAPKFRIVVVSDTKITDDTKKDDTKTTPPDNPTNPNGGNGGGSTTTSTTSPLTTIKKIDDLLPHFIPQTSLMLKVVSSLGLALGIFGLVASNELFVLPFRLWALFMYAFGLRKRYKPWGTVYDSVTKQPLDPAYVILKDEKGKEIATSITDLDGRYGFFVQKGSYYLSASKTHYLFPSQKMQGKTSDDLYTDLYFGEKLEITEDGAVIYKNIPMDQEGFDWNEFEKNKTRVMHFHRRHERLIRHISDWLFRIGFVFAAVALYFTPEPYNYIIFGLYLLVVVLRMLGLRPKVQGTIIDTATGLPLSFAVISIYSVALERELFKKVADQYGRYYALVPKGEYALTIAKKNPDETYTEVYKGSYNAKQGVINSAIKI